MKIHEHYDESKHEVIESNGEFFSPIAYGERHRIVVVIKEEVLSCEDCKEGEVRFKNGHSYGDMLAMSTFPEPPKPIGYTVVKDDHLLLVRY